MANRVSVLFDVATEKAVSSIGKFKSAMADAEANGTSKFKAGASQAFEGVKANAGAMATAAGAAIAGFAVDAALKFRDLGKATESFSQTLGSTPEEASRLLAVMDPLGIELGDAQDVFNNLAGLIDENDAALKSLGVTVAKDANGRVDMNESFLRIMESLQKVQDPAKKAALAAKFFGEEGARQFGPLVATADQLRAKLAAVSDAKVIDAEELAKAKKLDEAMKAVKLAFDNFTLAVGETVAGIAPYIQSLVKVIGYLEKIPGLQDAAFGGSIPTDLGKMGDGFRKMAEAAIASGDAVQYLVDKGFTVRGATGLLEDYNAEMAATKPATEDAAAATDELTTASVAADRAQRDLQYAQAALIVTGGAAAESWRDQKEAAEDAKDAADKHREATEKLRTAEQSLYDDRLSRVDANYAYLQAVRDNATAVEDLAVKLDDAETSERDAAAAIDNTVLSMADVAGKYADVNGHVQAGKERVDDMIESLENQRDALAPGSPLREAVQGYIDQLNAIKTDIETRFRVTISPVTGTPMGPGGTYTPPLSPGSTSTKRSDGPVVTNGMGFMPAASSNVNVTVMTGADPQMTVQAIKQWAKQNGPIAGIAS